MSTAGLVVICGRLWCDWRWWSAGIWQCCGGLGSALCVSGLVLALGLGLLLVLDFVGWFLRYFGRASVVCFGLGFCSVI